MMTLIRFIVKLNSLKRSFWGKVKDFFMGEDAGLAITKPYGVTYDGKSKIYIADTIKKGILVMDLNAGTTKFFNSLGSYGKLAEPVYIVLDKSGNIYVSDTKLKRVAVFDSEYNLKSLSEVEKFILEHKHLENFPDMDDTEGWAGLSMQDRDMK